MEDRPVKRRTFIMTLVMGFLFITGACGQERAHAADNEPPAPPPKRAAASPAGLKRTAAKPAFSGRVVRINLVSGTLSLKSRGNAVTFDASTPVLSGYRAFSDIRVGDPVAVSYAPDGIRVARLLDRPGADVETPPASRQRRTGGLLRRDPRTSGTDFNDVDANKDGKITPVELSVVIPDITLDRFRQHDANNDGYLDRAEFTEVIRQQKAPAKTR
jgi:hypothetical protein